MSTTTDAPTTIRLSAEQVRLAAQALAWRYGTQTEADQVVNRWLLDLLPAFVSPSAQVAGMYAAPLMGDHGRTVRRALSLYSKADGIPAGWRGAAEALWAQLIDAHRAAQRAGHED